jgi:hypothetical protein
MVTQDATESEGVSISGQREERVLRRALDSRGMKQYRLQKNA